MAHWKKRAVEEGLGGLYLISVQSFEETEPLGFGFDAALQFPPHNIQNRIKYNDRFQLFDPSNFNGELFEYSEIVESECNRYLPVSKKQIRCAFPAWDNSPRRTPEMGPSIYANSNPELFEKWVSSILRFADNNPIDGKKIIFLNAWNEWAEGAYLEPDQKFGYAYLNSVRKALSAKR
jgi:hypothetical protein